MITEFSQTSVGWSSMLHIYECIVLWVECRIEFRMYWTCLKCHKDEEVTHVLSVAMRQRQIPSRERKFLCLKPGSNLSQMYWIKEKKEVGEIKKKRPWVETRKEGLPETQSRGVGLNRLWIKVCTAIDIQKRALTPCPLTAQYTEQKTKFDWNSSRTVSCKCSWFIL